MSLAVSDDLKSEALEEGALPGTTMWLTSPSGLAHSQFRRARERGSGSHSDRGQCLSFSVRWGSSWLHFLPRWWLEPSQPLLTWVYRIPTVMLLAVDTIRCMSFAANTP